jgi:WD40 repeat protein
MNQERRFKAFISYSRADYAFARRFHRALESFAIPGDASFFSRRKTLGKFFLDLEDLSCAGSLPKAIRTALDQSESLIVLCSTHAARSAWVEQEIQYFRAKHGADRIFAAVCPGRGSLLNRTRERTENLLPPALLLHSDQRDLLAPAETPLAADFRRESFHKSVVRVATGLLGIPFDELWQRARRRRRARLWTAASISLSIVISAVFALRAYVAENGSSLARAMSGRVDTGNVDGGLALLLENGTMLDTATLLALEPEELRQAIFKGVLASGDTRWLWFLDANGKAWVADDLYPLNGGRAVVSLASRFKSPVHLLVDRSSRKILAPLTAGGPERIQRTDVVLAPALDRVLVVSPKGALHLWDTRTARAIAVLAAKPRESYERYACFHDASARLFVREDSGLVRAYDAKTGAAVGTIDIGGNDKDTLNCFDEILASTGAAQAAAIDAATLAVRKTSLERLHESLKLPENMGTPEDVQESRDGTRRFARSLDGWYGLFETATGKLIKTIREPEVGWDTSTVGHFVGGGTRIVLENRKYGVVVLVNAVNGKEIEEYERYYDTPTDIDADQRKTLTLYEQSAIELIDWKTGAVRSRIRVDDASVEYATTSLNDKFLVAILSGNRVRVWDAETLRHRLDSQVSEDIDTLDDVQIDEKLELVLVRTQKGTRVIDISAAPRRYASNSASAEGCNFEREDLSEDDLAWGCIEPGPLSAETAQTPASVPKPGLEAQLESERQRFDLDLIDEKQGWAALFHHGGDGSLIRRNPQTGRLEETKYEKDGDDDFLMMLASDRKTDSVLALGELRGDGVVVHRIRLRDGKRTRAIDPRWRTFYPFPIEGHAHGIVTNARTGNLELWNIEKDKVVLEFREMFWGSRCSAGREALHDAVVFECSEDAKLYPRGRATYSQVNSIVTGEKLFEGPRFIRFATRKRLAITMSDPAFGAVELQLYDTKTWKKLASLNGHPGGVTNCEFLNEDEWIVAGTREGSVVFWDTHTGVKFAERYFGEPVTVTVRQGGEKEIDLLVATQSGKVFRINLKTDLASLRALASEAVRDSRKGEEGLGRDAMLCAQSPAECDED